MGLNAVTPGIGSFAPPLREGSVKPEEATAARDVSRRPAPGGPVGGLPSEPAATIESVKEAVHRLDEHVQRAGRDLRFSMDESTGRVVVKVIDADTEQLIRQMPPDEILELARRFQGQEGSIVNFEI